VACVERSHHANSFSLLYRTMSSNVSLSLRCKFSLPSLRPTRPRLSALLCCSHVSPWSVRYSESTSLNVWRYFLSLSFFSSILLFSLSCSLSHYLFISSLVLFFLFFFFFSILFFLFFLCLSLSLIFFFCLTVFVRNEQASDSTASDRIDSS
jgi:hypothetical protein